MGTPARSTAPPALSQLLGESRLVAISLWVGPLRPVGWNGLADEIYGFSAADGSNRSLAAFQLRASDDFGNLAVIVFGHPLLGELTMHQTRMQVLGTHLSVWVHTPANSDTASTFERLSALGRGSSFIDVGRRADSC